MRWITGKFENVPLRDTHVLQQLPRRVGHALYFSPSRRLWKVLNELIEVLVRTLAPQQREEMATQDCVRILVDGFL